MNSPNHNLVHLKRNVEAIFLACFMIILMASCTREKPEVPQIKNIASIINPELKGKPNIVWIVAEDLSPYLPSFGDSTLVTPSLSKMAAEGVCYDNFYAPHPVCAPARAAIITGMYANSIGASHMRTGPWFGGRPDEKALASYQKAMPENIRPYEAVPPPEVRMFTEYLRSAGYYCSNNSKEDYQFIKTPTAWDDSSSKAHWRNRTEGQPFFSVFNIEVTHESQIWRKTKDSLWVPDDLEVPVPPYLPDTPLAKNDIRRMYSNIREMDARVGDILSELEEDGLLENTVVFWYSDHGGPLPRQKRLLYDSGLKVPLIIKFPGNQHQGQRDSRMTSFIDLAPTVLSLAGIDLPDHMQGTAFLGKNMRSEEPHYVFGAADRFDETTDRVRSVRDERFKYIKYYDPEKPMYLEVSYRNQMPVMKELLRLQKAGKLTAAQQLWFRSKKPEEELFDLSNDPYELHDLAKDPEYKEKLDELRLACGQWTDEIHDTGLIAEEQYIAQIHPDGKQPETGTPQIQIENNKMVLTCITEGASIGYKIFNADENPDQKPWQVYTHPAEIKEGQIIQVIAHRIGFLPSEVKAFVFQQTL